MIIIAYAYLQAMISADIVYISKVFADENRIQILNLLRNCELCVIISKLF